MGRPRKSCSLATEDQLSLASDSAAEAAKCHGATDSLDWTALRHISLGRTTGEKGLRKSSRKRFGVSDRRAQRDVTATAIRPNVRRIWRYRGANHRMRFIRGLDRFFHD